MKIIENEMPAEMQGLYSEWLSKQPVIRKSGGRFTVKLSSVGNPDYGQDPFRSMPGVPYCWAHVDSVEEAAKLVRHYIEFFDLGGGNWSGGEIVRQADGLVVGNVSYNGRFWATQQIEK